MYRCVLSTRTSKPYMVSTSSTLFSFWLCFSVRSGKLVEKQPAELIRQCRVGRYTLKRLLVAAKSRDKLSVSVRGLIPDSPGSARVPRNVAVIARQKVYKHLGFQNPTVALLLGGKSRVLVCCFISRINFLTGMVLVFAKFFV